MTKLNSALLPGSHPNRLNDDLYSRIGNSDTGSAGSEGRSDSNKCKEEEDRFHHRACVIFCNVISVIDGLSVVSRWPFTTARVAGKKVGRDSDDDVFGDGCEYQTGWNGRRDHKIPFVSRFLEKIDRIA